MVRMSDRLKNKRALVTASARGIGEDTVRAYAAEGADVLATDINGEVLSGLDCVDGIRTQIMDATDASGIKAIASAEEPFNILVNCAGIVHHGSALECSESDWDQACDLNVKSMFLTIREFIPGMQALGGGSIVNISSICAHRGLPNCFAYGATKAAVGRLGLASEIASVAAHIGSNESVFTSGVQINVDGGMSI